MWRYYYTIVRNFFRMLEAIKTTTNKIKRQANLDEIEKYLNKQKV